MADLRRRIQVLAARVEAQRRSVDIPAAWRRVRARLSRKLRDLVVDLGGEWHPLMPDVEALLAADSPAQQEADSRALAPFCTGAGEELRMKLEDIAKKLAEEDAEDLREW